MWEEGEGRTCIWGKDWMSSMKVIKSKCCPWSLHTLKGRLNATGYTWKERDTVKEDRLDCCLLREMEKTNPWHFYKEARSPGTYTGGLALDREWVM